MKKKAYIRTILSGVLPVEVTFPGNIGHYASLECALADVALFGCEPVFDLQ